MRQILVELSIFRGLNYFRYLSYEVKPVIICLNYTIIIQRVIYRKHDSEKEQRLGYHVDST